MKFKIYAVSSWHQAVVPSKGYIDIEVNKDYIVSILVHSLDNKDLPKYKKVTTKGSFFTKTKTIIVPDGYEKIEVWAVKLADGTILFSGENLASVVL